MGFAESCQHDLPPRLLQHCLNYPRLKSRLIDDPPDPWDDHPSMAAPETVSGSEDVEAAAPAAPTLATPKGSATLADRRTRVFAYELRAELDRLYDFYADECRACRSDLASVAAATAAPPPCLPSPKHQQRQMDLLTASPPEDAAAATVGRRRMRSVARRSASPSSRPLLDAGHASGVGGGGSGGGGADGTGPAFGEEERGIKASLIAVSNRIQALYMFRILNFNACVRLARAHAAQVHTGDGDGGGVGGAVAAALVAGLEELLLEAPLFNDGALKAAAEAAERLYADAYCHGDAAVARAVLARRAAAAAASTMRAQRRRLQLGLRLGAALVLAAWAAWDCAMGDAHPGGGAALWQDPAFRIFRGLGNVTLMVWAWAASLWVWRAHGVAYARCFEALPPPDASGSSGAKQSVGGAGGDDGVWRSSSGSGGGSGSGGDPAAAAASLACDLSLAFLAALLAFNKALRGALLAPALVPAPFAHALPLLLLAYMAQRLALPLATHAAPAARALRAVVAAPFVPVSFRDAFIGDVLTSTARVAVDLAFAALFIAAGARGWLAGDARAAVAAAAASADSSSGSAEAEAYAWFSSAVAPALTLAPLWLRFLQSLRRAWDTQLRLPHLANALKYAAALGVSAYGAARPGLHDSPLWVLCFVGATLYQYAWDVCVDWDLVRVARRAGGARGWTLSMRQRRLYPRRGAYIAAAALNLVLRFCWTVTIVPESSTSFLFTRRFQALASPWVAAAEIVRRAMWGLLRVEAEHLALNGGVAAAAAAAAPAARGGGGGDLGDVEMARAAAATSSSADGADALAGLRFTRMDVASVRGGRGSSGGGAAKGGGALAAALLGGGPAEARRRLFMAELTAYAAAMAAVIGLAFYG